MSSPNTKLAKSTQSDESGATNIAALTMAGIVNAGVIAAVVAVVFMMAGR